MLMWERLGFRRGAVRGKSVVSGTTRAVTRLPFDTRCSALTKAGRRCRARIVKGTDFCQFHDPTVSPERRREIASKGGRSRCGLAHIPGGYLRKLNTRRAVGDAMDRLYREVRLGIVTPEMGAVLFGILTRVMDSGLRETDKKMRGKVRRGRADRLRPKLTELLTRAELQAWRKAAMKAPSGFAYRHGKSQVAGKTDAIARSGAVALPAAS